MIRIRPSRGRPLLPGRSHLVRQYDRADCGPAALLSILRHWGGDAVLAEVRELAGTDLRGTTLLGLLGAARALGLDGRGVRARYDEIPRGSLPCIAHLVLEDGTSHFVVVRRVSPQQIWIGDPACGRRRMPRGEFEALWRTGALLLLTPTERIRTAPAPGWIRWIAGYFREERTWLVQSIFLGAVGTLLGLATALFVHWLIDRFIPARDVRMILATGAALLALLLLRAGAGYLRQTFLVRLNHRISIRVNEDFLEHLFQLPLRFFESRAMGDITTRVADGIRIQRALLEVVGTAVIDGLLVVGALVFLHLLALPLGLIALSTLPLYAAILLRVASQLREEEKAARSAYAQVEASYIDSLRGISEILGFGVAAPFARANASLHRLFQARVERLGLIRAGLSLFMEGTGGVLIVSVLVWGAVLVVEGRLLLGELMAGYALLGSMLPAIDRLVVAAAALQEASVAATRLRDLLLTTPEPAAAGRPFRLERELRLEEAVLERPAGNRLFDRMDLTLVRGRVTGLTGPNGAGKSTLVRVLTRSVPLSAGRLLVDGVPAEEFALRGYRRKVSVLPANVRLFSGTLGRNLTLGREGAEPAEILAWVDERGLRRFLDRFPERWDTVVGEGGRRLSSGERQVVGLLRALMDSPEVLLVDEGVTSTDGEISRLLLNSLLRYGEEHVVLIISHDPRVLLRTDHLYALAQGTILDEGPPAEILARREHGRRNGYG